MGRSQKSFSRKISLILLVFFLVNGRALTQNMIYIPGGSFMMGDALGLGEADELPLRNITLQAYSIGKYEVTFMEYDAFCQATWTEKPEDNGWGRGIRPVINVSWYDAVLYCNWRSTQEGFTPCYTIDKIHPDTANKSVQDLERWLVQCNFQANGYRLPTEAEWEFAARSGNAAIPLPVVGIDSVAWYNSNAKVMTRSVGLKRANTLGIHDLSGNVAEWCWDWHQSSYEDCGTHNPTGASTGEARIIRGGSWEDSPSELRITNRNALSPHLRNQRNVGFRLVRKG